MLKVLSGGVFYILMSVTFSAVVYSGETSNLNLACSDFPPSKIKNSTDDKPGYDIEIIRAALARVGIKVNVEFFPWKRALFLAKEGKMDGLCSCSYVQSREAYFKYSDEVGYLRIGLFYPPGYGEEPAENLKSLKDKKVGVVRGYNLHDELTQLGLTVEPVNSNLNGIRMLYHNRIDVYYGFRNPVIYTVLSELNLPEPIFHELRRSPYYVCLSRKLKDVDVVIQRLNEGLQEIRSSGEFQKILSRYP